MYGTIEILNSQIVTEYAHNLAYREFLNQVLVPAAVDNANMVHDGFVSFEYTLQNQESNNSLKPFIFSLTNHSLMKSKFHSSSFHKQGMATMSKNRLQVECGDSD